MPNFQKYEAESKLIKEKLINQAHKEALKFNIKEGTNGGELDAFRHAYISAIYTFKRGVLPAFLLGLGVEIQGNSDPKIDKSESENMDLWNNRVGREIGLEANSEGEIAVNVYRALKMGKLITKEDDTYKEEIGIGYQILLKLGKAFYRKTKYDSFYPD